MYAAAAKDCVKHDAAFVLAMVFPALSEACTCQDNSVNIIVLARKIVKKMMIVMTILMMMIMMTILKIKMTVKFRIGDAN